MWGTMILVSSILAYLETPFTCLLKSFNCVSIREKVSVVVYRYVVVCGMMFADKVPRQVRVSFYLYLAFYANFIIRAIFKTRPNGEFWRYFWGFHAIFREIWKESKLQNMKFEIWNLPFWSHSNRTRNKNVPKGYNNKNRENWVITVIARKNRPVAKGQATMPVEKMNPLLLDNAKGRGREVIVGSLRHVHHPKPCMRSWIRVLVREFAFSQFILSIMNYHWMKHVWSCSSRGSCRY